MFQARPKRSSGAWSVAALSALGLLLTTFGGRAGDQVAVSQRNKLFAPSSITIDKGQALDIVNDDGSTVHHAYVESDAFNFDSGDQQPGKHVAIAFPGRGRFTVLCGIHPKMKLDVTVK